MNPRYTVGVAIVVENKMTNYIKNIVMIVFLEI